MLIFLAIIGAIALAAAILIGVALWVGSQAAAWATAEQVAA